MDASEVAVVGLGTMGAGIAEVFARAGLTVVAIEVDPGALERGMATLDRSLARAVTRGKLTEPEKADILGRVRPATGLAAAAGADLAVEVVPERMEIKRQVFAELDRVCRPDAILVTNTSSLSVTAIAAATRDPARVAGLHFFNPAQVMRLVEVVTTVRTAPETGQAVTDLVQRLGKTPIRVPDRAGFIVNALLLPYLNHAARLLETGYASREDIDAAATAGLGLPMGPLALLDLIGLDTSLSVLEVLHAEFGGPRFAAAPMLRRLVEAGLTGRKTGRGFYEYRQKEPPQPPGPASIHNGEPAAGPGTVTLTGSGAGPGAPLGALIEAAGWPLAAGSYGAGPGGAGSYGAGPGGAGSYGAGPGGAGSYGAGPGGAGSYGAGPGGAGSYGAGPGGAGSYGAGPGGAGSYGAGPGGAGSYGAGPGGAGSYGAGPGGAGSYGAGPGGAGHVGAHRGGAPDDNDPDVHDLDAHDRASGLPGGAGPGGLIIVAEAEPGESVLSVALATGRAADAVGLHLASDRLAELVSTPVSAPQAVEAAAVLAGRLGVTVVRCPDRPGFLAGALLYPHLNDAVRMVQDGYASAADIDLAMVLGCGYPSGPLQLLDAAGPDRAKAVLTRMHEYYAEPAFAPAPLLAEHVAAGLAFRQPRP